MARMVQEAQNRGANAVIAMRFDSGSIGQWSEICAYGTAVWVQPVSDYAKQQFEAMQQSGELPHQQEYSPNVSEWATRPRPPGRRSDHRLSAWHSDRKTDHMI